MSMTAWRARGWGGMTATLDIDALLDAGREVGADGRLACGTEGGPDGSGGVRHRPSPCSARAMRAVIACAVSVVDTRGGCGTRVVTAHGMRRTIDS